MRILVLQHARVEHPGAFRALLAADNHLWKTVHLNEGDVLPTIDQFDALWVLGGPMDVWEEHDYPWLGPEKALIRETVVERKMPFLGLCLGHQLLAVALGGQCKKAAVPEVGVMEVQLTQEGKNSPFLNGIDDTVTCLQWHGTEVSEVPQSCNVLAYSKSCAVQGLSVGTHALSMQFHVEVESDTVGNWAAVPEYGEALHKALGEDGAVKLTSDCLQSMDTFNNLALQLYRNWINTVEA